MNDKNQEPMQEGRHEKKVREERQERQEKEAGPPASSRPIPTQIRPQTQKDRSEADWADLIRQRDSLREQLRIADVDLTAVKRERDAHLSRAQDLQDRVTQLLGEAETHLKQVEILSGKIARQQAAIEKAEATSASHCGQVTELQRRLSAIQAVVEALA